MGYWFPKPPNNPFGTTWAQAIEYIGKGKNPVNRRVTSTSYLTMLGDSDWPEQSVGLVLHQTLLVAYHRDGTFTLDHGGYRTVTTGYYLNTFTPFWFYSNYGGKQRGWVLGYTGKNTPSKVQKCRTCSGTGFDPWQMQQSRRSGGMTHPNSAMGKCYRCDGKKIVDYGNKPIPIIWGNHDRPVRMTVRKRKQRGVDWLHHQQVLETGVQRLYAPEFQKMPPPWRPDYVIQGL